jgi:hypothetical protein
MKFCTVYRPATVCAATRSGERKTLRNAGTNSPSTAMAGVRFGLREESGDPVFPTTSFIHR